jgi:hypothetical protein
VSTSDQTPEVDSNELAAGGSKKAGSPAQRPLHASRSRVRNILDLITYAIDDPARTRRLAVLIATTGVCLAGIIFVIEFRPDRWAYVVIVAYSIVAMARLGRRGKSASHAQRAVVRSAQRNRSSDVGGRANPRPSRRRAPRQR